jgi:hypothetical protein
MNAPAPAPRAAALKRRRRLACILLAGLASTGAHGKDHPLFVIERSKNANIVKYDARLTPTGGLDAKQPVSVYWLLLAEDGRREDRNTLERVKAYGFDIKPDPAGATWIMILAAYRKRPITVRPTESGARAEIVIAGRPAQLDRLYINATDGRLLPSVNYIELFGTDLASGEKRHERLVPD